MDDLIVKGSVQEDILRIAFEGKLMYETSLRARELLEPFIRQLPDGGKCILVASGLTKIDSTGFGVFIHFIRQVAVKKARFTVVVDNPFILELFKIAKFNLIMTIVASEQEACAALAEDAQHPLAARDY